jgi:Domain of unknown function (DUF6456)
MARPRKSKPLKHQAPRRIAKPLVWFAKRRRRSGASLLRAELVQAGEQLARDFQKAQLMPRVTMDWSMVKVDGGRQRGLPREHAEASERAAGAQQRVHRALKAVGSELSGLLVDVCCLEHRLEAAERAEGWPQRAGKVVLEIALTRLARHYGLLAPAPPAGGRLRHWGDSDYRPTMDAWRDAPPDDTPGVP